MDESSILTDRGSQFYASESESREGNASEFERELARLDIRRILVSVNNSLADGKLQRFHGEIQKKLHLFHGMDDFVDWYNNIQPHMSLDFKIPASMFIERMPQKGAATERQNVHAEE